MTTKEGLYKADVTIHGILTPGKTFFPQHWSREKVINTIIEAYDDFIKKGATNFTLGKKGELDLLRKLK